MKHDLAYKDHFVHWTLDTHSHSLLFMDGMCFVCLENERDREAK